MDVQQKLIRDLQANTLKHNYLAAMALRNGRDYIVPQDITEAFENGQDENKIRLDILEILGNGTGFGTEDDSLCAFVAWQGKEK